MNTIKTIIVDGDQEDRARLQAALEQFDSIEVVATCAKGEELAFFLEKHGDVGMVVLDADHPDSRGFEVAAQLGGCDEGPCVVFVSNDLELAGRAFEHDAHDFLLKSFSPERVKTAVERVRCCLKKRSILRATKPHNGTFARSPECFFVKNGETYSIVRAKEIIWAESAGNYMVLYTERGNQLIRRTVAALAEELEALNFMRVNRSAIVNLNCVEEIEQGSSSDFDIRLRGDVKVPYTGNLRDLKRSLKAAV